MDRPAIKAFYTAAMDKFKDSRGAGFTVPTSLVLCIHVIPVFSDSPSSQCTSGISSFKGMFGSMGRTMGVDEVRRFHTSLDRRLTAVADDPDVGALGVEAAADVGTLLWTVSPTRHLSRTGARYLQHIAVLFAFFAYFNVSEGPSEGVFHELQLSRSAPEVVTVARSSAQRLGLRLPSVDLAFLEKHRDEDALTTGGGTQEPKCDNETCRTSKQARCPAAHVMLPATVAGVPEGGLAEAQADVLCPLEQGCWGWCGGGQDTVQPGLRQVAGTDVSCMRVRQGYILQHSMYGHS